MGRSVYSLEQLAAPEIVAETRRKLRDDGMGWGELKNQLFTARKRAVPVLPQVRKAIGID